MQLGVSADRLKTISYGKERPQCTESNEAAGRRTAARISVGTVDPCGARAAEACAGPAHQATWRAS